MTSYGKLCTQYYDLDKTGPPPDALAYYLHQADIADGPILEPMCGSGRFLLPLMQAGYKVTGIDASPEMLAACRRKAHKLGLDPDLYQQTLQKMKLPGTYGLVLIPSGSFGLITDLDEACESLRRIIEHINPGGRVVLECDQWMSPPETNPIPGESKVMKPDNSKIRLISSGSFDTDAHIYHGYNCYEHWVQDRLIEQEFEQLDLRYYDPHNLAGLLEEVGFAVQEAHAAFNSHLPLEVAESFVVVAVKP